MNYKALGIYNEMNKEFSQWAELDLMKLIDSEYFFAPRASRRNSSKYCEILVIDCQRNDWWYSKLIGFKFFCEIIFNKYGNNIVFISDFKGVRLTSSKKIAFRCFDPKDVIIL